ncbi:MAG TPA: 2OG-Fe(II) oxygenase [Allosphingosinicella sp.]|nr:2OG-Fe(II) oxygenase [Allosphingosinicella sp.]
MTDLEGEYRIAIGSWVRDRLAANPAVLKIPAKGLDAFVAREFLTARECDGLIRLIDAERIPSQVLAPTEDPEFRTSESCNLDPLDPLVQQVEAKISGLMGIDPMRSETIQGQRYAVGQQFKAHHDFFHPGEPYWPEMQRTGGQRTWTAMVFLNVPEGGGQTVFENAGLKVVPRRGNLLTWNNLDARGEPNFYSLHQGCPVTAGVKYIITKWYRERAWTYSSVNTY